MGNPMGSNTETYYGPKGLVTLVQQNRGDGTAADPTGNRRARRLWAKQHGKPMPRHTEGTDVSDASDTTNEAA